MNIRIETPKAFINRKVEAKQYIERMLDQKKELKSAYGKANIERYSAQCKSDSIGEQMATSKMNMIEKYIEACDLAIAETKRLGHAVSVELTNC